MILSNQKHRSVLRSQIIIKPDGNIAPPPTNKKHMAKIRECCGCEFACRKNDRQNGENSRVNKFADRVRRKNETSRTERARKRGVKRMRGSYGSYIGNM